MPDNTARAKKITTALLVVKKLPELLIGKNSARSIKKNGSECNFEFKPELYL